MKLAEIVYQYSVNGLEMLVGNADALNAAHNKVENMIDDIELLDTMEVPIDEHQRSFLTHLKAIKIDIEYMQNDCIVAA